MLYILFLLPPYILISTNYYIVVLVCRRRRFLFLSLRSAAPRPKNNTILLEKAIFVNHKLTACNDSPWRLVGKTL